MEQLSGESSLLRIFTGELDKYKRRPLYEAIVYFAKRKGLAGATVQKGIMSFGASSIVKTAKTLALSHDLPIIIEIIDKTEKIEQFIKELEPYFEKSKYGGIVTIEKANVIYYFPKT